MGQFCTVLAWMADRRECSRWQIVSRCRERARQVYYGAVVEIKKEIPVNSTCGRRALYVHFTASVCGSSSAWPISFVMDLGVGSRAAQGPR